MSRLLDLPDELKLKIAEYLRHKDIYHLARTSTRFSAIFRKEAAEYIELRARLRQKYRYAFVASSGDREYGIEADLAGEQIVYWDTEDFMDSIIKKPDMLPFIRHITFSDQILYDLAGSYEQIDTADKPHGKRLLRYLQMVCANQFINDLGLMSKEDAVKNGRTDVLEAHILTKVLNVEVLYIRPCIEQIYLLDFFKTIVKASGQTELSIQANMKFTRITSFLPLQHLSFVSIDQHGLRDNNITVEWVYWLLQLPNLVTLHIDDVNGTGPLEDLKRTPVLKYLRIRAWNFGPSLAWLLRNVSLELLEYSQMVPHSVEYPFEISKYIDALKVKSRERLKELKCYVLEPRQNGSYSHSLYSGPKEVPITVLQPCSVLPKLDFPNLEVLKYDWNHLRLVDGELDLPISLKKLRLVHCPLQQNDMLEQFVSERCTLLNTVDFEFEFAQNKSDEERRKMFTHWMNLAKAYGLVWGTTAIRW